MSPDVASTAAVAAPDPATAPRFRAEGIAGSMDGGAVFLKLAIVLIVGLAAVWVANRKGWLERWKGRGQTVAAARGRRTLAVVESLRVGPRTLVHRVRDGDRDYLLVESSAQIAFSAVPHGHGEAADEAQ